ncbi:glycolate oxidase subunit GlcF [Methylococcaceae bacterium WWC4]|nr:glycolate oxidase subunit GlcF [Methylococcaceae bacterium WWC4]
MQTVIAEPLKYTPQGAVAEQLLRACVHCGFCNAVCPTYRLLGDELDGPRGRIYLIKQTLETGVADAASLAHLDRCLTCRSCETACPSGVEYGRLLDIGRELTAKPGIRSRRQRWLRRGLVAALAYPRRAAWLIGAALRLKPWLPGFLRAKLPDRQAAEMWPAPRHQRQVLIPQGCLQPALAPRIDAATARVLDNLGISAVSLPTGCCGALPYHLDCQAEGLTMMRATVEHCWRELQAGAEAVVSTASGCGVTLKDYGRLLADDPDYAAKAAAVAAKTRDIAELLSGEDLSRLAIRTCRVAVHSPCTLQHGQGLPGIVESLLKGLGFELATVADADLCCGSAGSYSLLQPAIAERLRDAKLTALQAGAADVIVTANIGCWLHLRERATLPVRYWIELLDTGAPG